MPSSVSKGSTAIAGSIGETLSCPSASSDAAVAASRRSAELISCSARRTSSSGAGCCRKPGRELVQQAADLFGGVDEQARLVLGAVADHLGARERVLERAREMREVGEADRRRAAGERVRQRDRHLADRTVQLHRPFGDLGHQAARELVGLVEIDVEERDADAQRTDDLDVLVARRLGARDIGADLEVDGTGCRRRAPPQRLRRWRGRATARPSGRANAPCPRLARATGSAPARRPARRGRGRRRKTPRRNRRRCGRRRSGRTSPTRRGWRASAPAARRHRARTSARPSGRASRDRARTTGRRRRQERSPTPLPVLRPAALPVQRPADATRGRCCSAGPRGTPSAARCRAPARRRGRCRRACPPRPARRARCASPIGARQCPRPSRRGSRGPSRQTRSAAALRPAARPAAC